MDRYKLYKRNDDYIFEAWGGSTKHPDITFRFSDWKSKSDIIENEHQLFQWVLYIASIEIFPFHAKELAEWALENLISWE